MTVQLHLGDCLEVMAGMDANSIDTVITDPPYGLEFMGKEWDKLARPKPGNLGGFADGNKPSFERVKRHLPAMQEWHYAWAIEALRVAKPGAVLLAFGGTRTWHRLACAIEDAGWEIRDCMMWLYGQGFSKGLDISKAIDKAAGAEREVVGMNPNARPNSDNRGEGVYGGGSGSDHAPHLTAPATDAAALWDGWNTTLKPAWEPVIVAMKPLDGTFVNNALTHGVAGLWIDGARIATGEYLGRPKGQEVSTYNRSQYREKMLGQITSEPTGRWPANLILDETAAAMLDEQSGTLKSGDCPNGFSGEYKAQVYGKYAANLIRPETVYADQGGASRFFYQAKASKRERWFFCHICDDAFPAAKREAHMHGKEKQDHIFMHPTQKPLGLMEYLCKLTRTPSGGVVLDPFMGTGTTGRACVTTERGFIGIDKEYPTYMIAKRRTQAVARQLRLF